MPDSLARNNDDGLAHIQELLDNLLHTIANAQHRDPNQELAAFFPVKGARYDGKLMVVGRAVNGWGKGFLPQELVEPKSRREVIVLARKAAGKDPSRPLSWITDDWKETDYNPKRSAFWRLIRLLTHNLGIANDSEIEWPSHIVWSNLYKISPDEGGNPSNQLCSLQESQCIRMLQQEIALWHPNRIVFLTGYNWAKPFVEALGTAKAVSNGSLVQAVGRVTLPTDAGATFVVAPHPQGKPSARLAQDIGAALSDS